MNRHKKQIIAHRVFVRNGGIKTSNSEIMYPKSFVSNFWGLSVKQKRFSL
ncbi:Uncharacterised protein [Prevotella disiens]|uniref:Uncharacterized protein n=2 Tax=Prevotellaceae TaxID=171552 RepID=A0A2U0TX23_9BACT|nr:hypothetical protein C7379_12910 [Hallella colorans]SUB97397.1 Uncharacterised protein [Prevotella disiens]